MPFRQLARAVGGESPGDDEWHPISGGVDSHAMDGNPPVDRSSRADRYRDM
jgi:hypothetical protein